MSLLHNPAIRNSRLLHPRNHRLEGQSDQPDLLPDAHQIRPVAAHQSHSQPIHIHFPGCHGIPRDLPASHLRREVYRQSCYSTRQYPLAMAVHCKYLLLHYVRHHHMYAAIGWGRANGISDGLECVVVSARGFGECRERVWRSAKRAMVRVWGGCTVIKRS